MWYENKLTHDLGIQYPIIQAGMAGGTTTPELTAAVSNAGGLGTLGAGYMSAETMRETIRTTKTLTSKPYGVNVFIPEIPEVSEVAIDKANELLRPFREVLGVAAPDVTKPTTDLFHQQLDVIMEEHVPVISFTFGVPSPETVQQLQNKHITVIGTATTVREAIINEDRGVDMVVMQGSEAGGHRGTFSGTFDNGMVGTMALVPQTADHINIPIIAAGGIMDGRAVSAALTLGARAVQMGTAFVTALESGAKAQHVDAILNSAEDQTVITSAFSGKPARGIQNEFITKMTPYEHDLPGYPVLNALTKDIRREAARQNRPKWIHLWSGQAPRLSKKEPAGDIVQAIVSQVNGIEENR